MDKTKIQKLRELAQKATPGPWEANGEAVDTENNSAYNVALCHLAYRGGNWSGTDYAAKSYQLANASFIAAANPAVVLELLAIAESAAAAPADCPDCRNTGRVYNEGEYDGTCPICLAGAAARDAKKAQAAAPAEGVDTPDFDKLLTHFYETAYSFAGSTPSPSARAAVIAHITAWGAQRYEAGAKQGVRDSFDHLLYAAANTDSDEYATSLHGAAQLVLEFDPEGRDEWLKITELVTENRKLCARAEAAEAERDRWHKLADERAAEIVRLDTELASSRQKEAPHLEELLRGWQKLYGDFNEELQAALASRPAVDLSALARFDAVQFGPVTDGAYYMVSDVQALLAQAGPARAPDVASPDPIVELNVAMLRARSILGVKKYGTTLADNKLPLRAWLVHALEESLDLSNYLQAAMQHIDNAPAVSGGELPPLPVPFSDLHPIAEMHDGISEHIDADLFDKRQMQAYALQARDDALEEAAKLCGTFSREWTVVEHLAAAIRALSKKGRE